jgi:TatD DNase family protein
VLFRSARVRGLPCAIGLHPHEAVHWDAAAPALEAAWAAPECRLVGEIGLDYFYEHSPREAQRQVFARQLERAAALGKRVVIHTRDAAEDTLALLREHRPRLDAALPGVIHCFTDSAATAQALLELGFMISFSGILTFKAADAVRAAARIVPPERLLYETDSPFLAPVPHRGKRNEPAYAPLVLQKLAELHGAAVEQLAAVTLQNFHRLLA